MIHLLPALLFLVPIPAPAVQSESVAPDWRPASQNAPVMRLDGEEISLEEYSHWMLDTFGARSATIFAGDYLIEKEARRRGVGLAPEEVISELDRQLKLRIDGAFFGSKEGWLSELARTQRTESGIRAQRTQELEIEFLTKKSVAIDRVVPEVKIEREWELSYGRGGRAYDLSMLFLRCVFLTPEDILPAPEKERLRLAEMEARRLRAMELRARIVAGEDFAKVALEASDDESSRSNGAKSRGGYRQYGWPHNFLAVMDQLSAGDISEPVYAKGGWWIVRVDGLVHTPLEGVRGELVARLEERGPEQDETGTFRNALVDAARIEVLPSLFVDPATNVESAALATAMTIDGEPVSRATYGRWFMRTRGEASFPAFVEQRVVINEALRRGIEVTQADVRARTEEYLTRLIKLDHKGSREAWRAQLSMESRDEAMFLHDLDIRMRIELLCERLILLDRVIPPEAVRLRFEDVYGKDGNSIQARMILLNVLVSPGAEGETPEQLQARTAAAMQSVRVRGDALARIVRDGGDFASLARQHSEDPPSAALGGTLDARFRADLWPGTVAKAVLGLPVGGVTDAMEFGTCFVILQVTAREETKFDAVREVLAEQMRLEPPRRTDLNLYRNVLVNKAKIELLDGMNR